MILKNATFDGVGSAIYLGLGPLPPDFVKIQNMEVGDYHYILEWNRNMRSGEMNEGIRYLIPLSASNSSATRLTVGQGIIPYDGATVVAAGNTTYLDSIEMFPDVFTDQKRSNVANGYAAINTWTLDTSGSRTGHWNDEANITYVGEGSIIRVRQDADNALKTATLLGVSNNGEAANEVTLSSAITTGRIEYLGPMYDLIVAPAKHIVRAGIYIAETTINASGNMCQIEYGWYDLPIAR